MKHKPKEKTIKKGFSLLEIIFVVLLLAIVSTQVIPKNPTSKLQLAVNKMVLYLNYTRYIAHIDNKFDINDSQWERKRWTLKFQNCDSSIGGLYYIVYSDMSGGTAHFKKEETLKDPLNGKYLYSNGCQKDSVGDKSKYVLLTQEYGVTKVDVSCNTTDTIGQISFGYDGRIYSRLGTDIKEIEEQCIITLYDQNNDSASISVEAKTGYIGKI